MPRQLTIKCPEQVTCPQTSTRGREGPSCHRPGGPIWEKGHRCPVLCGHSQGASTHDQVVFTLSCTECDPPGVPVRRFLLKSGFMMQRLELEGVN